MATDALLACAFGPFFGLCALLVIDDMTTMVRRPRARREGDDDSGPPGGATMNEENTARAQRLDAGLAVKQRRLRAVGR